METDNTFIYLVVSFALGFVIGFRVCGYVVKRMIKDGDIVITLTNKGKEILKGGK